MSETSGTDCMKEVSSKRAGGWADSSIEEKIERLRRVLQTLPLELRHLQQRLAVLDNHQHGSQGQILVAHHMYGYGIPQGTTPGHGFDPLA